MPEFSPTGRGASQRGTLKSALSTNIFPLNPDHGEPITVNIEEAIEQLDLDLRKLKIQYDMFFVGSAPRQPFELKRQVETLIRTFSNSSIKRYSDRFRFNTLVGRYNALSELWGKQLRVIEESGRAPAIPIPAPRPVPKGPRPSEGETVCFSVKIEDPERERETMRLLYERYLEARGEGAAAGSALKLESFVKQIAKQASNLRESSGCRSIEFRVLRKGDSVSLRARAGS